MRQNWVDIAKGIAIIAVVIGHIRYSWPNTKLLPLSDICIWLWHVPVFFMIGGFFLKKDRLINPREFIIGKVKSLYLPLIYIYIPFLIFHNLCIYIGFYDVRIDYYGKYVSWWGISDFLEHMIEALLCAGREPILGAMWFGFVLFLALCIISITNWGIKVIGKRLKEETQEEVLSLIFLCMAVASCSLTQLLGITIPRFNNTLVAVWLVYVGMVLVQKYGIEFSNGIFAFACAVIAWHSSTSKGAVNLVANDFRDVIVLTVTSGACLYVVCYISKKIEKVTWIRLLLSKVGRDSLYIMGLHFVGFKFATIFLNVLGYNSNLAILVPNVEGHILFLMLYVIFGVFVPLVIIEGFRFLKIVICKR